MNSSDSINALLRLKKKQVIIFQQNNFKNYPPSTGPHRLRVLYKAKKSGDTFLVKCKVLGNGDWYKEVYLTSSDFFHDRIKYN